VNSATIDLATEIRKGPPIWTPLLLLIAMTLAVRAGGFDLYWQHVFWSAESGWRFARNGAVQFLYHYGTWPALLMGALSALVWVYSQGKGAWESLQPLSLFLALLLVFGPGVLVNAIFKPHYGRPRPIDTRDFGGRETFRAIGEFGGKGKSFPSGHASMGFYWFGLFFYLWNRRRGLAWLFCGLGLLHGGLMGLGRMAQGGHWFTDVLWSAGFVYLTGWVLHRILSAQTSPAAKPVASEIQYSV